MLSVNLQVFPQISRFFDLDLQVFGLLGLRGLLLLQLEVFRSMSFTYLHDSNAVYSDAAVSGFIF